MADAPALPKAEVVVAGADRETWLAERRKGIGGSDIAALMGLGTRSAATVILDKQGFGEEMEDNDLLRFGRRMEPVLQQTLEEDYGVPVVVLPKEVLYRSVELPIALASPDALTSDGGAEFKNVSSFKAPEWSDGEIPVAYLAQCQWYLGVTGFQVWHAVALIGGNSPRHVVVQADPQLFADMCAVAEKAWVHVENGTLPALDGSSATTRALTQKFRQHVEGKSIEGGARLNQLLVQLAVAAELRSAADERETAVKNEIRALLGDAEVGLVEGDTAVTYRSSVVPAHMVRESTRRTLRPVKRGER